MSSAQAKLLRHFQNNVGKYLSLKELAAIAQTSDWTRSVRTLKQLGHDIENVKKGEHKGCYIMHSLRMKEGKVRKQIDGKTRYRILHRDNSTCQRCGRKLGDGFRLVIDHKIPVEWDGSSDDENLWVLCEECNLGKKHWLSDANADEMKIIFAEKSAEFRLKKYFEIHPNELIDVMQLHLVGGIREWTRTVRFLRKKYGMNIQPVRKNKVHGDAYIYLKQASRTQN